MVAEALSNNDAGKVSALILDPTTVVGASDAGAPADDVRGRRLHAAAHRARAHRGDLTVEGAVHQLTGRIADAFGIAAAACCALPAGDAVVFADEPGVPARAVRHRPPAGTAHPRPRLPHDRRRCGHQERTAWRGARRDLDAG
jgi:N-acyl-D-aspartate/D-glutamate deacylase